LREGYDAERQRKDSVEKKRRGVRDAVIGRNSVSGARNKTRKKKKKKEKNEN
jgi:hypothetical protein